MTQVYQGVMRRGGERSALAFLMKIQDLIYSAMCCRISRARHIPNLWNLISSLLEDYIDYVDILVA